MNRKESSRRWYEKNKERILEEGKERYKNPEVRSRSKERCKSYYRRNKERLKAKQRKYDEENRETIILRRKEQRQTPEGKRKTKEYNNRLEVKARNKIYWKSEKGKSVRRKIEKKYRQKPEVRKKINGDNYKRKVRRRKEDKIFRIIDNLRARLRRAFGHYSKNGKIMTSRLYGVSYKKIIEHLKPFPKDLDNYEVDHIIPLCRFNLNDPEQIKIAFSPSNHQWLTKEENLEKGGRLVMPHYA